MLLFFFTPCADPEDLHSFPTRRSSDLGDGYRDGSTCRRVLLRVGQQVAEHLPHSRRVDVYRDRRLRQAHREPRSEEHTSELSHSQISYAVFCLKKKIQPILLTTLVLVW